MTPAAEIIEEAVREFNARNDHAQVKLTLIGYEIEHKWGATVALEAPGIKKRFNVECKKHVNTQTLGTIVARLKEMPGQPILAADYINTAIAEKLRDMDVQFLDTAGNAYLREPPLYIYVTGNKPKQIAEKQPMRLFHPQGLKVLFALICNPKMAARPLREIGKYTGVNHATVRNVLTHLERLGNIYEHGAKERRLVNIKTLIDQWVMQYPVNLRPKLFIARYKATTAEGWHAIDMKGFKAYWGGEVAADTLTDYLKPATATIYIYDDAFKFVIKNRLVEDPQGNIELLKAFWSEELNQPARGAIVPALMIYADLLASGEPRNIETAKIVYEKELAGLIEQA